MSTYNNPFPDVPSASEMHRIAKCPASKKMAKHAKDYSDHKDADKGNRVHAILAGEEDADDSPYDAAQTAEMCDEQAAQLVREWKLEADDIPLVYSETRYGMTTLGNVINVVEGSRAEFVVTGQLDKLYVCGNRGILIDYKALHGKHAHALENAQLATLAVLVAGRHHLDSLRVAIVQPWKGKPTTADYHAGSFAEARRWMFGVLEREKNATLEDRHAGDHCNHCKARFGCDTFINRNIEALDIVRPETLPVDSKSRAAAVFARVAEMTPAQSIHIEENVIGLMGVFIAAHKALFKARVEAGEIPGYGIETSPGNREITDAQKAHEALSPLGVTSEDIIAACSLPLGAMQEAVRVRSGIKSKTEKRTLYNLTADQARAVMDKALTDAGCLARKAEKSKVVKLTLEVGA
jgi:hypothetical protein